MEINNDENIVLQSLYNAKLILNLINSNFIGSEYFNKLNINQNLKKVFTQQIGLNNRGMILLLLYSLLVIPKEIFKNYKNEEIQILNLNKEIKDMVLEETYTTYEYDNENFNYIRHIRNSVAHAEVKFQNVKIIFKDEHWNRYHKRNEICEIHILYSNIGKLICECEKTITNYNNNIAKKFQY